MGSHLEGNTITRVRWLTLLFVFSAMAGFGQNTNTVIIDDSFQYVYPDSARAFFLEDSLGKLGATDFFSEYSAGRVKANYEKIPYFGKSASSWWLGMVIQNNTHAAKRLVVEVDFVYLDNLDFYLWENGRLIKTVKGYSWKMPSLSRPIPHRVFAVDFETTPQKWYVWAIKIQSQDGALPVPFRLFDYHVFEHLSKVNYNTHAFSIGIMFLAVIMGLALYGLSRDVMYAYYGGYIFSLAGMVLGEQGYFNQYFLRLNESLPTPNVWIYFMATGIFCHVQFSLIFLKINHHKNKPWVVVGKILTFASALLFVLSMIPHMAGPIYEAALILGICFNFLNITFILVAFKQKNPVAIFYLIAVAPFTICAAYICFSTLGVIPESWLIFELFNYGPVWEILVLSIVVCVEYQSRLKQQNKAVLALSQAETAKLIAIKDAQETDRQRIASELHDSVGALISALKLNWDTYKKSDVSLNSKMFASTDNLLDHLTKEVRRVSHELMPTSLIEHGIIAALEQIYSEHTAPIIRIIGNQYDGQKLSVEQEILLLRIVQELTTNSLRHANATEISIQLVSEPGKVCLLYEDDGVGLPNHDLSCYKGMGSQNISSRLKYLGGKMEIQFSQKRGFLCLIEIPV